MSEFKHEPKQVLNKVRTLLKMNLELAQMKLEDGVTVLEAEEFAEGFSVGIVQEDGIVAAPVGEHTLEDGRVLVVEEEGIIASISEPTAEEEPANPEMDSEPSSAAPKKVVESVTKETFFKDHEIAVELMKEHEVALSEIETLKTERDELKKELALAQEVKPIVHNPENKKEVKFSDLPKHVQLLKMREKLN